MLLTSIKIVFLTTAILITWQLLKALFKLVDQITDYFIGTISPDGLWVKIAPFKTIIQESIYYTNDILFNKGIERFPKLKISYYHHKRFNGQYNNDVITIFKKRNKTISDAVEITLHEVAHYIQDYSDNRYKKYEAYSSEVGYDSNPLEVEARDFARHHLNDCLLYLEEKGLVLRV